MFSHRSIIILSFLLGRTITKTLLSFNSIPSGEPLLAASALPAFAARRSISYPSFGHFRAGALGNRLESSDSGLSRRKMQVNQPLEGSVFMMLKSCGKKRLWPSHSAGPQVKRRTQSLALYKNINNSIDWKLVFLAS
jgi:hypothetical protein